MRSAVVCCFLAPAVALVTRLSPHGASCARSRRPSSLRALPDRALKLEALQARCVAVRAALIAPTLLMAEEVAVTDALAAAAGAMSAGDAPADFLPGLPTPADFLPADTLAALTPRRDAPATASTFHHPTPSGGGGSIDSGGALAMRSTSVSRTYCQTYWLRTAAICVPCVWTRKSWVSVYE